MRILLLSFLILLQGCAALTRRNYIDLNEAKKETVYSSDILTFGDSQFEVQVYNRNSYLSYLTVGLLVPIVPISLFSRDISPSGTFNVEFVLAAKTGANSDASLDFSAMTLEEPLTASKTVCWLYSVKQILISSDYDLPRVVSEKMLSSGKKLYQLSCNLAANSIPPSEGVFLKVLGIKAVDRKTQKTFALPDLLFKYRNTYQYELFSPM